MSSRLTTAEIGTSCLSSAVIKSSMVSDRVDKTGNAIDFHPSLVDAWAFSGYSNDNPPAGIKGIKENVLTPNGFAWTEDSGFNKGTHQGSLVLDGVKDYLKLDKIEYALGTIIIGLDGRTPVANQWNYILDCSSYRTFIAYENQVLKSGNNGEGLHEEDNVIVSDYMVRAIKTPIYIGCKDTVIEHLQMNLRYIGIYGATLNAEEQERERVKLERHWLSQMQKTN